MHPRRISVVGEIAADEDVMPASCRIVPAVSRCFWSDASFADGLRKWATWPFVVGDAHAAVAEPTTRSHS